jgi:hypothetical protein
MLPTVTKGGFEESATETVPGGISLTVRLTVDDWLYNPPIVWDIALRNIGYVPLFMPVIVQLGVHVLLAFMP